MANFTTFTEYNSLNLLSNQRELFQKPGAAIAIRTQTNWFRKPIAAEISLATDGSVTCRQSEAKFGRLDATNALP